MTDELKVPVLAKSSEEDFTAGVIDDFLQAMEETDELVTITLKSHLLIEQMMDRVIALKLPSDIES